MRILFLVVMVLVHPGHQARQRRCFTCRSRGELGDCRDPFHLSANSTLVKGHEGVKMLPCTSGWCKKFVGGSKAQLIKGDQELETERGCLTWGPPDEKPRCFPHQFGEMCICKGDLCNGTRGTHHLSYTLLLSIAFAIFGLQWALVG